MRTRGTHLALVGTLALSGLAGGVVLAPALATAATSEESAGEAVQGRVDRLKEALQGLVDDDTLTEAQRDRVAETLAEQLPPRGPGNGRGHGHSRAGKHLALDVAAETLGLDEAVLRERLRAGESLAEVAEAEGVELSTLTGALQAEAEERLAQAVEDGRLTQEQADERKAGLPERIADAVQREGLGRGRGHGPRLPAEPDAQEETAEPRTEGSVYTS